MWTWPWRSLATGPERHRGRRRLVDHRRCRRAPLTPRGGIVRRRIWPRLGLLGRLNLLGGQSDGHCLPRRRRRRARGSRIRRNRTLRRRLGSRGGTWRRDRGIPYRGIRGRAHDRQRQDRSKSTAPTHTDHHAGRQPDSATFSGHAIRDRATSAAEPRLDREGVRADPVIPRIRSASPRCFRRGSHGNRGRPECAAQRLAHTAARSTRGRLLGNRGLRSTRAH